jgi:methylated-DNA-protein-cysteine methyltransferase-like protein
MTPFQKKVAQIVTRIRRGTTLSYGEVALRAGRPGAPRAVVSALRSLDLPWWRVARHDGTFAPQVAREQEALLRQEGWKRKGKRKISPRRREDAKKSLLGGTRGRRRSEQERGRTPARKK